LRAAFPAHRVLLDESSATATARGWHLYRRMVIEFSDVPERAP
jgi:hypothetical protein